ncbi:MAG: hypothetical protein LUH10_15835 [Tannerellaceae bacterium]|nr:hypothetical protein [Tannerellaceae bacterium]
MKKLPVIFSTSAEGYSIHAEIKSIGPDLLIMITGGDTPHIGTVTTVSGEVEVKTILFPSCQGRFHKDHIIAEKIANIIKPYFPGNCVITSGVHVEQITKKQIAASIEMAEELGTQIKMWLNK